MHYHLVQESSPNTAPQWVAVFRVAGQQITASSRARIFCPAFSQSRACFRKTDLQNIHACSPIMFFGSDQSQIYPHGVKFSAQRC